MGCFLFDLGMKIIFRLGIIFFRESIRVISSDEEDVVFGEIVYFGFWV